MHLSLSVPSSLQHLQMLGHPIHQLPACRYVCSAIIGLGLVLLYVGSVSDPGFITAQNIEQMTALYPYDGFIYVSKRCRTCLWQRPARSKHCPVCNRWHPCQTTSTKCCGCACKTTRIQTPHCLMQAAVHIVHMHPASLTEVSIRTSFSFHCFTSSSNANGSLLQAEALDQDAPCNALGHSIAHICMQLSWSRLYNCLWKQLGISKPILPPLPVQPCLVVHHNKPQTRSRNTHGEGGQGRGLSRCVARHDHHCAWLNNCVGLKNLRYFMAFMITNLVVCLYGTPYCQGSLACGVNS